MNMVFQGKDYSDTYGEEAKDCILAHDVSAARRICKELGLEV